MSFAILFVHILIPENNPHLFYAEGVFNYTTMLVKEDLDLLVVGAGETIYVLDLHNISKKLAAVRALLLILQIQQHPHIVGTIHTKMYHQSFFPLGLANFKDKFVCHFTHFFTLHLFK